MDSRFSTQAGIYEILEQADAVPGIFDVRIGRWLAWPAIKVLIYARLFNALDDAPLASPAARRMFNGVSLFSKLPATWRHLRGLLAQLPPATAKPRVAWLSGAYGRRDPDGTERDAIFADLPADFTPHAQQVWLHPPVLPAAADGVHAEPVYDVAVDLSNQLTSLQRFRPAVRLAARELGEKLSAVTPGVGELSWQRVCLDALSMFEARRSVWTIVFAKMQPVLVVMTNAPYLSGEVAAAQSCRALVAEFQHGLFGPRCPEYGWPGALAPRRADMPVADRLFVFGDLFRGGALKNAFWRAGDLRVIGSADVERRRSPHVIPVPATPPRIVFLTQPATRVAAIAFWDAFLGGVQSGAYPRSTLTIKVHPSEGHERAAYATLATRHPGLCVISVEEDAARVMLEHDFVVGYTSFALIQAVGLGRAAISLSGEQAPGGIFALCPIPGAAAAMPVVSTPAELAALLPQLPRTSDSTAANGFFARQPPGALLHAALDLLRASDRPRHSPSES